MLHSTFQNGPKAPEGLNSYDFTNFIMKSQQTVKSSSFGEFFVYLAGYSMARGCGLIIKQLWAQHKMDMWPYPSTVYQILL